MIDPLTGDISFEDTATVLGPRLTRSAFLRSDLARRASDVVDNPPWYTCDIRCCLSVLPFIVEIQFRRESLVKVSLMHSSDDYGTSFVDYTPDKIALRMQRHEAWLADVCHLRPGRFSWGKVDAYHTDRDMRTAITVSYFFPVGG